MKKSGFTLIELLVVISIFGLLASFLFNSGEDAIQKANNIQITKTTKAYRDAFLMYQASYGQYPDRDSWGSCLGLGHPNIDSDPEGECRTESYPYEESATLHAELLNLVPTLQPAIFPRELLIGTDVYATGSWVEPLLNPSVSTYTLYGQTVPTTDVPDDYLTMRYVLEGPDANCGLGPLVRRNGTDYETSNTNSNSGNLPNGYNNRGNTLCIILLPNE